MRIDRLIQRLVQVAGEGNVAGGVSGAVVSGSGSKSVRVSSRRRVVQRNGRTIVDESTTDVQRSGDPDQPIRPNEEQS